MHSTLIGKKYFKIFLNCLKISERSISVVATVAKFRLNFKKLSKRVLKKKLDDPVNKALTYVFRTFFFAFAPSNMFQ